MEKYVQTEPLRKPATFHLRSYIDYLWKLELFQAVVFGH